MLPPEGLPPDSDRRPRGIRKRQLAIWAIVAAIALVLALFLTERRPQPGPLVGDQPIDRSHAVPNPEGERAVPADDQTEPPTNPQTP